MFGQGIKFSKRYVVVTFVLGAIVGALSCLVFSLCRAADEGTPGQLISADCRNVTVQTMVGKFGEPCRSRIQRGVEQVARCWSANDGTMRDFERFCLESFATDSAELHDSLMRFDASLASIIGNLRAVTVDCRTPLQRGQDRLLRVDTLIAGYFPLRRLSEDLFESKAAFFALLNFRQAALSEKIRDGAHWSREEWAGVRLCDLFSFRVSRSRRSRSSNSSSIAEHANDPGEPLGLAERLACLARESNDSAPYSPMYHDYLARSFDSLREMSANDVERILETFLASDAVKKVGELMSRRLRRALVSTDLSYRGFSETDSPNEASSAVCYAYPDLIAFASDIPNILIRFGLASDSARFVADHIIVEPSRTGAHTEGSYTLSRSVRLRVPVVAGTGLDSRSLDGATHELGHCVEHILTLRNADYYLMSDSPDMLKECSAFLFQNRSRDPKPSDVVNTRKQALATLREFLQAEYLSGLALVEIRIWRWLAAHPDAEPAQLVSEANSIAEEVWNTFFEPVFGSRNSRNLNLCPFMVNSPLYCSNYPISQMVNYQLKAYLEGKRLGPELDRLSKLGRLPPKIWMEQATGQEITPSSFLDAVKAACTTVGQ